MTDTIGGDVDMKSTTFGIGEVGRRFGLAAHVLRHWESEGLLDPTRVGGQRRYSMADLYRVAAILRAKQAGLSLVEIRALFVTSDPQVRRDTLQGHRDDLAVRIGELQASLDLVDSALACDHRDLSTCPRFRDNLAGLVNDSSPTRRDRAQRPVRPSRPGTGS